MEWIKSSTLPMLMPFDGGQLESRMLWIVVNGVVIKGWYNSNGGWNSFQTKESDLKCSHWMPYSYQEPIPPNPPNLPTYKPPTFAQANKIAYQLGKESKKCGWDKTSSPYKNNIAAQYWDAGYSGMKITNFRTGHQKPQCLLTQPQYDVLIRILKAMNDEQLNELKMMCGRKK